MSMICLIAFLCKSSTNQYSLPNPTIYKGWINMLTQSKSFLSKIYIIMNHTFDSQGEIREASKYNFPASEMCPCFHNTLPNRSNASVSADKLSILFKECKASSREVSSVNGNSTKTLHKAKYCGMAFLGDWHHKESNQKYFLDRQTSRTMGSDGISSCTKSNFASRDRYSALTQ
ncbi:hypothetical protein AGLY_010782, partial [Aphis glycines]